MSDDARPLAGKTALLTGATSGIGIPTAAGLLRAGARLLAVSRDPDRERAAREALAREVPGGEITFLRADLTRMSEVRRVADEVAGLAPSLHALVNNAGAFSPRPELTEDGFERTFAINHFAPILLANLLLANLRAAGGGARIVQVGSAAADRATSPLADLEDRAAFSTLGAYTRSKLALLMASIEMARREEAGAVTINVVHPGLIATRIGDVGGITGIVWRLFRPLFKRPEEGARTSLAAALSPDYAGRTGLYIKAAGPAKPNPLARDAALCAQVYEITMRRLGIEA